MASMIPLKSYSKVILYIHQEHLIVKVFHFYFPQRVFDTWHFIIIFFKLHKIYDYF